MNKKFFQVILRPTIYPTEEERQKEESLLKYIDNLLKIAHLSTIYPIYTVYGVDNFINKLWFLCVFYAYLLTFAIFENFSKSCHISG